MNHDHSKSWLEKLTHILSHEPQSREELLALLRDAKARDLLDHDALSMMEGVLQVSEMKVRDAMIPRTQMVTLAAEATAYEVMKTIIDSSHSRFPIVSENQEKIIGILLAKELLRYDQETLKNTQLKSLARSATFIPESKRLDVLLKEFRLSRNHMAVVIDEYGNVSGLITIEDVLEEIVGDIVDESDPENEPMIRRLNKNSFLVDPLTPLAEFNAYFSTSYEEDEFDTIGGVLLKAFSHLPKRGEALTLDEYDVTVIEAGLREMKLLKFKKRV